MRKTINSPTVGPTVVTIAVGATVAHGFGQALAGVKAQLPSVNSKSSIAMSPANPLP